MFSVPAQLSFRYTKMFMVQFYLRSLKFIKNGKTNFFPLKGEMVPINPRTNDGISASELNKTQQMLIDN